MSGAVRLYVGGIGAKVDENALSRQFSNYGTVATVDLKDKKDAEGNVLTRFAYISINAKQENIHQCIHELNGTSWKGSKLRVEQAKESFIERLKREREQNLQHNQKYIDEDERLAPDTRKEYDLKLKEFSEKFNTSRKLNHEKEHKSDEQTPTKKSKKRKKKKRNDSGSDSDDDIRQGIPMFRGTGNISTEESSVNIKNKAKFTKKNEAEEVMLSSFKEFSSVWADSDSECEMKPKRKKPKENETEYEQNKDMGIFVDFNKANNEHINSALVFKKSKKLEKDESENAELEEECIGDVTQEKDDQYKILSQVLGKTISPTKQRKHVAGDQIVPRFDPKLPEHEELYQRKHVKSEMKSSSVEAIPELQQKYVKVSQELNFKEKSSGFSFLQQFSENITEEYVEPEMKFVVSEELTSSNKIVKTRPFFINADDQLIKDGIEWMGQNLKENMVEQFFDTRPEIMDICETRVARVKQDIRNKRTKKPREWGNNKRFVKAK